MNTKASISRRQRAIRATQNSDAAHSTKAARDEFTLADVIAFSPEQLPHPWLYDSDALIRDLDRIHELVQLIPLHMDTYSPTNVAAAAVWDLRTKLIYLIDLHRQMQRSWREKTSDQKASNLPTQDAAAGFSR